MWDQRGEVYGGAFQGRCKDVAEHNSLYSVVPLQRYTMAMKVEDHSRLWHDVHITGELFHLFCREHRGCRLGAPLV